MRGSLAAGWPRPLLGRAGAAVAPTWCLVCALGCGAAGAPHGPTVEHQACAPATAAAPIAATSTASSTPPAAGDAAPFEPRSLLCEAVGQPVSARVQRSRDGSRLAGKAFSHYESAELARCERSAPNVIRCEGAWGFTKSPAKLEVTWQADGSVLGRLVRPEGAVAVMSCVASANDLHPPTE